MKKLITELTVITVMLLLGVWNVNGQTGSILLETNFENWKPTIGVDQANGTYSVPDASLKIQGPKFNNSSTPNAGTVGYPNYFRFGSAGSTTNQFIEVTPSKEFVNGGRITVVISTNSNAGATDVFSIADGPSASTDISKTFANFNQIGKVHTTVSVDLPTDYTGIKTIRLFRTATTTFLHYLKIETNPAAPTISAFEVAGVTATIDESAKTITAELPFGTDITALTPTVTLGGTATSYTPTGAQDFSNSSTTPVTYTATDGTNTTTYAVTLTAKATASDDATLSDLRVDGATVTGFASTTTEYDVVLPYGSANPVVTAVKNDPAASDPVITNVTSLPGSATVVVTAQAGNSQTYTINFTVAEAGKELTELIFTNSFSAFIVDKEAEKTVKAYYMEGEEKPTILSSVVSAGASVAINTEGTKVIVTGEDHTTKEFDLTLEPVTPFTGITPLIFDGSETWIKTGYTYETSKGWPFAKAVEEASNKRISEGKTRIYFFVGNYSKLTFTSGTSVRAIKVFLNDGTQLASPTTTAASGSTFDIDLNGADKYMVGIYSNQTSGDGGVTALTTTPNTPTSTKNLKKSEISFDGSIIHNPKNTFLNVFDITGRLVVSSNKNIEMNSNQKGIYIVKSETDAMKINVR